MTILEFNVGTANTLPGPIDTIVCQSGEGIIVDRTTNPPTVTYLRTDDSYDGEGKAGLQLIDIDGSRWYTESSLESRTQGQMVTTPDLRPEVHTDVHGEVKGDNDPSDDHETGTYESRSKHSLYELAKERDLDVTSKSSKEDLIAALRGE